MTAANNLLLCGAKMNKEYAETMPYLAGLFPLFSTVLLLISVIIFIVYLSLQFQHGCKLDSVPVHASSK